MVSHFISTVSFKCCCHAGPPPPHDYGYRDRHEIFNGGPGPYHRRPPAEHQVSETHPACVRPYQQSGTQVLRHLLNLKLCCSCDISPSPIQC